MADTEYYQNLRSNPPVKHKAPRPRVERWSLVWLFGAQSITLLSDKPYALCKDAENKAKREIQFRNGKFKIVPFK